MKNTTRAAVWMIGAIVSFTLMALAGREISAELDTFEIMLFRSLIGLLIVLLVLRATRGFGQISTTHLRLHLSRNLAHFIAQNLWFFSLTLIPLAQVFALEFTAPIWVIILAPIFLGERLRPIQWFYASLGFLGILIITQPGLTKIGPGVIAASGAAVGFAVTMLITKHLTKLAGIGEILFFLTGFQAIFGLVCAGFDGDIALPSANGWPFVFVIGASGLMAHFSITRALKIAPASFVAPIDFARLPIIALLGYIFYQEPIDVWIFFGAALIFAGNYLNILFQSHNQP